MAEDEKPLDKIVYELRERAKELNCLYHVQEILNAPDISTKAACEGIIRAIPPGWQYPDVCQVEIILGEMICRSEGFVESPWGQHQDIIIQDRAVGRISVYYTEERAEENEGPFLKEERKLINTIAEQLGMFLLHQQLKKVFEAQQQTPERKAEWWVILDLLRRTDPSLLVRISRKMVNLLIREGVTEADDMLDFFSPAYRIDHDLLDDNQPSKLDARPNQLAFIEEIFELASRHLNETEILDHVQAWFKEDQSDFLAHVLVHPGSSLDQIDSAIERYHHLAEGGLELTRPRESSVKTALTRRLLKDDTAFIDTAKKFISIDSYYNLFQKLIYSSGSHGTVGGKSAGIILADLILQKAARGNPLLKDIKIPKTWYITSDSLFDFLSHNGIEEVIEHKYRSLEQVRQEYPYIIHIFKNSSLPPDILKSLQIVIDDFGTTPLIVRSSSLLEDRTGMAFAGKYKSLFIANQGTKEERLEALVDAITEVYASMFGPDPIEYRLEHGLIDQHEEMGILIQEVVGAQIGDFYMPAFAGVAFSSNQFPWSKRIKPEDGLVRLVPGLGTRAVNRLSNDYPIMVTPGQPGLRIHLSPEETIRYSPKFADAININEGNFSTIELSELFKVHGSEFPEIAKLVSKVSEGYIQHPVGGRLDFSKGSLVITFENLISHSPFLQQVDAILAELENSLGYPVDIEFAHDGTYLYLLQCRSQNFSPAIQPAEIPTGIEEDRIIFSTDQFVTNGMFNNISHLVYVDPTKYDRLAEHKDLVEVGRTIGKLNKILPRREFILIGPGRWGSRGDIKLGIPVTFADIRNSAMLIEVAFPTSSSSYEPSFGTHFFQDLVEASIRFLPLDPKQPYIYLNTEFLLSSGNSLAELLPQAAHLADVIKVIDIEAVTDYSAIHIHMNSEEHKAIAFLNDEKI